MILVQEGVVRKECMNVPTMYVTGLKSSENAIIPWCFGVVVLLLKKQYSG